MITTTTAQIIEQEVCVDKRWVCVDDLKEEIIKLKRQPNGTAYVMAYNNALKDVEEVLQ